MTAGAVSRVADDPAPLSRKRVRRNLGVIAFCRWGGGSRFLKARSCDCTEGRRTFWFLRWKGLNLKCFRNAKATWPVALSTVLATTACLRRPINRPSVDHSAVLMQETNDFATMSISCWDKEERRGLEVRPAMSQNPSQRRQLRSWSSLELSCLPSKRIREFAAPQQPKTKSFWEVERWRSLPVSVSVSVGGNDG